MCECVSVMLPVKEDVWVSKTSKRNPFSQSSTVYCVFSPFPERWVRLFLFLGGLLRLTWQTLLSPLLPPLVLQNVHCNACSTCIQGGRPR